MPIRITDFVATGLVKVDPCTLSQTLEGTNGDDTIDGSVGHDTIYGLEGKDTLIGRDGNDRLEGGGGEDLIYADAGNDVASGEDSAAFDAWTDFTGSNAN